MKKRKSYAASKDLTKKQKRDQSILLSTMKACNEREKQDALDGITPEQRWRMRFSEPPSGNMTSDLFPSWAKESPGD